MLFRSDFARQAAAAGVTFVGPQPDVLNRLGDKASARALAQRLDIPVIEGSEPVATEKDATAVARRLGGGPVVLKAVAGGGGRGIRVVRDSARLAEAFARSRSEAERAFGRGDLYVERYAEHVRHIEVQALGDGYIDEL